MRATDVVRLSRFPRPRPPAPCVRDFRVSLFDIINVILPIYLLIGLGFVSVWRGWLPSEAVGGFGRFVRNFALPSAIFIALVQRDLGEVLHLGFMLAFGVASLTSFAISLALARRLSGQHPSMLGILALAGSMSNGLMIGIPLITGLFGLESMATIAQQLIIENALLLPLGLALAELGQVRARSNRDARDTSAALVLVKTLRGLMTNPMVVALLLGLLVSGLGLSLPSGLENAVALLAASVGGMALVFIGTTLYGTDLRATVKDLLPTVAIKSVFHPLFMALSFWVVLLVWKAMGWMPVPAVYANAAVVIASLPTIGTLPAIAAGFGQGRPVSLAVLIMTGISVITTPLTIWLILTFQPFAV